MPGSAPRSLERETRGVSLYPPKRTSGRVRTFDPGVPTGAETVRYRYMQPIKILQATTLLAAGASLAMSVWLYFGGGEKLDGIFVGIWVPSILSLGAFIVASSRRSG